MSRRLEYSRGTAPTIVQSSLPIRRCYGLQRHSGLQFPFGAVDQWYASGCRLLLVAQLHGMFTPHSQDAADFLGSGVHEQHPGEAPDAFTFRSTDANGNKIDSEAKTPSRERLAWDLGQGNTSLSVADPDSLAVAQSAADAWFRQLPAKTQSPMGTWTLVLPGTQTMLDLLRK